MAKQERGEGGKFAPKSDEPRSVRTMRLTDTAWIKLGEIADSRGITRADLIEEWVRQPPTSQADQLKLFEIPLEEAIPTKEVITTDTRKTGAELAHRINLTSGAISNWNSDGTLYQKTKKHDPDHIGWERVPGTKKYRPVF